MFDQVHRPAPSAQPDQQPGLRIGDAEREQAAESLGAHLRAGRLGVTEYDERLQQAFAARTHAQLAPLFTDLPGGSPATVAAPPPRRTERRSPRTMAVPVRAVIMLALVAGAIAWTALTAFPLLFLIPVVWFGFGRRFGPRRHHGYPVARRY